MNKEGKMNRHSKYNILILTFLNVILFAQYGFAEGEWIQLKVAAGPFCLPQVDWTEIATFSSSEAKLIFCMNDKIPLKLSDLSKTQILQTLKKVKSDCGYKGNIQIPENLQWKTASVLNSEALEKIILKNFLKNAMMGEAAVESVKNNVSAEENALAQTQDVKIQVLHQSNDKIKCAELQTLDAKDLKFESKNFMRWNLLTQSGPLSLTAEFKVFKKIPVLKRNLSMGDRLSSEDWEWAEKDVTFNSSVLINPELFEGHALAKGMVAGQSISSHDLKREFLVEKSQMVKVRMSGADFEISSQAIADSSGYQGDWVKLKNLDTQKAFAGVVVGRGLVEVR